MILLSLIALFSIVSARIDDPEVNMTAPEIIRYWGYPSEEHFATTQDGYILGLHRIPRGRTDSMENSCRPVVFMQHGLESDSINWIANLPDESAGFLFADAGFDVWLGNMRGNTYSKNHTNFTVNDEKFWEFSWDEMQLFDLPAMIDYVHAATNQTSLYYIGHSQGTLTMFSRLSLDPQFGSKIRKFFALAPIGTVKYSKGFLPLFSQNFINELELFEDLFGSGEFLGNDGIVSLIAKWLCDDIEGDKICDSMIFLISGPETTSQFNATRTEVYIAHDPAGTSSQNMLHWMQMFVAGTVTRFDYGSARKNTQHYGTAIPPSYNFTTVATDMYLYWSDDDFLADPQDFTELLLPMLNREYVKVNSHLTGFSHLDFIWGLDAASIIYNSIIEIIKDDLGGNIKR
ncbi:hypothetical protein PFISCL1PPCAC_785 [Pristionchus fissidentatus]|uniref:Lipase n=1 Tax=Pristionchus fissidentatus TaxID=1538716 RepID=A0AAV5UTD6_9BILA|nr:hypothetical protein PFISCL1PPCAC_785 [Pristionchus fissidentatus]